MNHYKTIKREENTCLGPEGQVSIPLDMRRTLGLKGGDYLSFIPAGKGILILPQKSAVSESAKIISKLMSEKRLNQKELIKGLEEAKNRVYRKYYGFKKG